MGTVEPTGISILWFPIVSVLTFLGGRAGGVFAVACIDLCLALILGGGWEIAGVRMDSTDLSLGMMAYLTLSGRDDTLRHYVGRLPHMWLWAIVLVAITVSYLNVPMNAHRLSDPARATYQVYRYCLRPLLAYPITMLILMHHWDRENRLLKVVVHLSAVAALYTIYHALSGQAAVGFMHHKNMMAGALVAPMIIALGLAQGAESARGRAYAFGSFLTIAVAITVSGSRGGFVAAMVGALVYVLVMAQFAGGRARLVRLAAVGVTALTLAVVGAPDLDRLPGVQALSELQQGTEVANLSWRMELRWPHFLEMALEHPWIGVGSDTDPMMEGEASTPHNGYLTLALRYGFPMMIGVMLLVFYSAIHGLGSFYRKDLPARERIALLSVGAGLIGVLVHNIVESTIAVPYTQKLVFMLCATAAITARMPYSPPSAESKPLRHRTRWRRGFYAARAQSG